ncbi:hypothetical protein ACH47Z_38730 [Streptomyces sp. NPDC020192]|uniref:hypothetical protein n=1 Tax=Streptomyces sp. NPDC020192 TaxID=3365066 RepID=UPI0037AD5347
MAVFSRTPNKLDPGRVGLGIRRPGLQLGDALGRFGVELLGLGGPEGDRVARACGRGRCAGFGHDHTEPKSTGVPW